VLPVFIETLFTNKNQLKRQHSFDPSTVQNPRKSPVSPGGSMQKNLTASANNADISLSSTITDAAVPSSAKNTPLMPPSATPRLADLEGTMDTASPFKKQRASFAANDGLNILGLLGSGFTPNSNLHPQSATAVEVDQTRERAKAASSALAAQMQSSASEPGPSTEQSQGLTTGPELLPAVSEPGPEHFRRDNEDEEL